MSLEQCVWTPQLAFLPALRNFGDFTAIYFDFDFPAMNECLEHSTLEPGFFLLSHVVS